MRTLEPLPTSDYEVCPHVDARTFGRWFLENKRITLEAFCMNEGIDYDALPVLVDEVLTEWELKEETHRDRKETVSHMLNHLRIKKNARRNNQGRPVQTASGLSQSRADRLKAVAGEILYRLGPGQA